MTAARLSLRATLRGIAVAALAVVTGTAATIAEAKAQAYRRASGVFCPTMRYRLDIGDKLIGGDFDRLSRWLEHFSS